MRDTYRAAAMEVHVKEDPMDVDAMATKDSLRNRRWLKDTTPDFIAANLHNLNLLPVQSKPTAVAIFVTADVGQITDGWRVPNVIFKVTFPSKFAENQYQVENGIYELLGERDLPFVMQHLQTYTKPTQSLLTSDFQTLQDELRAHLDDLETRKGDEYDLKTANILMCERGSGQALKDCLHTLPQEDIKHIFLQTAFCLAYFEEIRVMHHDLHLGNIWIDESDKPFEYRLYVDETSPIVFTTRRMVKIYDFDLGFVQSDEIPENHILHDFCGKYGMCNEFQAGRDYLQFCWWLNNSLGDKLPPEVRNIIRNTVPSDFLTASAPNEITWAGQPCRAQQSRECERVETQSLKEMMAGIRDTFMRNTTPVVDASNETPVADVVPTPVYLPSVREFWLAKDPFSGGTTMRAAPSRETSR